MILSLAGTSIESGIRPTCKYVVTKTPDAELLEGQTVDKRCKMPFNTYSLNLVHSVLVRNSDLEILQTN
jgi:hypothetical protein